MSSKEYLKSVHRLGRILLFVGILIMLAIPTIIAIAFDAFPGVSEVLKASMGLLAIFIPLGVSEVLSYTPILGSACYVTFLTGNLLNLKIPAILNAKEIANVESGTEKSDIVSAIAASVSAIVTTLIIIAGILLLQPIAPVLNNPSIKLAASYVLPALFGALTLGLLGKNVGGGVMIEGKLLPAIIPAILMVVLYFTQPFLVHNLQGVLIIVAIGIIYPSAKFLYKRGKIKVTLPGDK